MRVLTFCALLWAGACVGQVTPVNKPSITFANGFEAEDSTAWSAASQTSPGICSFDSPSVTSERSHSGRYAAKAEFNLESGQKGPSCNGVKPNEHQDKNIYDAQFIEPGLSKLRIAAWFYIKSPEHTVEKRHAQKFFYLLAKGSAPRFVVTADYDQAAKKPSVYVSYNTGTGGSHALYGADSEVKTKNASGEGIVNLPYDEWFYLEFAVDFKTGKGADDSAIHVYFGTDKEAPTEVFRKTKHWSMDHCSSSTTRTCPAFPDDSMMENRIREFRVGAQVDRQQDREVHEIRYWDDVMITGE